MEKQKSMEMGKQQQQQQPEEEESSHYNRGGLNNLPPLRCIVKLGGAAITCKHEIEKTNEENLRTVSSQLRQAMMTESSSAKVSGMDWSKGLGNLEVPTADDFEKNPMLNAGNFVIVHGAGSFGHFQASRSGVHKGGLQLPFVKAGFVATRISVTSLNLEIVRALAREGIPSVGMSPFACGWSTWERNIAHADISQLSKTIDCGFVPVLHGDAVFDDLQGCTILSGDVIIRHLAQLLHPKYVVFLTDVLGVYDRPPQDSNAVLLKEIAVDEDGSWSIVKPILETNKVEIRVASHDTTGGMATKISEAAMIAKLGIDVYIVKAGTSHSLRALTGEITRSIPDDWLGTVIRFSKQTNATD
ncbi:Aspartate/glutamate/uridylate kinase [Cinnamomum micranthum f. kanehirae]|uniref:Isopentenyl phosphate kinase n=1 Tax=Cinnamomum micranthum f. kanehirae TaxID=337451 RepID=A0A443NGB7_9MAGN|nr:Aspartate/glutamate/uridylate kinase [Cinnamomum micranthum f. kanehirae]